MFHRLFHETTTTRPRPSIRLPPSSSVFTIHLAPTLSLSKKYLSADRGNRRPENGCRGNRYRRPWPMKKKVVLRVQMCCDRGRTKSLETVASIIGVLSVALEGAERNLVVVVGEDIDPVTITEKLRKKAGQTELVKVEGIVSGGEETDDDGDDQHQWPAARNAYPNYIAPCQICEGYHPTPGCSIM